jgi:type II secretory pathway component GspD/PulD (secretin)
VLSYADPKSVKDMLVKTGQLREDQIEVYQGEQAYAAVDDSTKLSEVSTGAAGAAGSSSVKPIETNLSSSPRNALLVKAVPSQMDTISALISELDRRPQLIDLEVRVCEAQEGALKNLGIAVNGADTATYAPSSTTWTEQQSEKGAIEAFTAGSFNRSPLSFIAALNTQIQDKTVNVLAQPTLSTVEGKQAIYFAGETVPYISKVSQTPTGSQIEVSFLKLGVTLNFKPRMDADGKLTIDVNPIVSSLLEFRKIGDLVEAPRTSERQLATTVRVGDCEPFVLAGLISSDERKTVTKIPFLADLPLVGKMFRNTSRTGQRTEIIVVVVPHIHE